MTVDEAIRVNVTRLRRDETHPDQGLPIIGLGDGIYRLTATADPDRWFRETNERNNTTWVELRLTTSVDPPLVKVVRSGPIRSTS